MRRTLTLTMLSLGLSLAVPGPQGLPSVEAHGSFNTWTFDAKTGLLLGKKGGVEVWRRTGPFAAPTGLALFVSGREVVLFSTDAQAGRVYLSAYALETGRPLWTNRLYDRFANASAAWQGQSGRTLLVQGFGGEPSFGKVFGVSLDTGKTLWDARQELLGFAGGKALILDYGVASPMDRAGELPLQRVQTETGAQANLSLTIPMRPGCGAMNYQGSIPDLRFTNKYLYALRQDSCGKFIARFDWHGDGTPVPLVYPDRRPPVPSTR